jgi:hypothetical protein
MKHSQNFQALCWPRLHISADNHLRKLQHLRKKGFINVGNFPRGTTACDLRIISKLLWVYDDVRKLCRQQAEVNLNHENSNYRNNGQGEARYRKYKTLKLGDGQA